MPGSMWVPHPSVGGGQNQDHTLVYMSMFVALENTGPTYSHSNVVLSEHHRHCDIKMQSHTGREGERTGNRTSSTIARRQVAEASQRS